MYYLGQSDLPVKPVTRRITFTRGMASAVRQAYLQKGGRCPINRKGYPVTGIPVAATRRNLFRGTALGTFTDLDLSRKPGQDTLGGLFDPVTLTVKTRSGRRASVHPYEGGAILTSPVSNLGASILDPITPFKTTYTASPPSIPSVIAAPAPASSGFWNPIAALVDTWNARPQVLKDIKVTVSPNKLMQAAQTVLKPGQVQSFVDKASQWGVNFDYRGMPISGQTAGFGYRLAGINWAAYLPWILGGGAVLLLAPMLLGRRK
ncbi:MAG: hypothetical protein ACREA9_24185 [Pyrinomonadaceae bacterium]